MKKGSINTMIKRYKKLSLALTTALILTACGGTRTETTEPIGIERIVAYAKNGGSIPTLQDYLNAGVIGIDTEEKLAEINQVIEGLVAEDVDTAQEIQALANMANIVVPPVDTTAPVIRTIGNKVKVMNDTTGAMIEHDLCKPLDFKNTNGGERRTHNKWMQGIAVLDNGFYITSLNLKEKNEEGEYKEKYLLINLLDSNGKSVGNYQVPYKSHGQDLSIKKVDENKYFIYTQSSDAKGIIELSFDTKNINFNNPEYSDKKLNIFKNKEIIIDNNLFGITSTLNFEKDKFVSVGYVKGKKRKEIKFIINDIANGLVKKNSFKFSLEYLENDGKYTQGIAMKDNKIYLLRGDYGVENYDKRLFIFNAKTGKLLDSYILNMKNKAMYLKTEPEGLTIESNTLYFGYPKIDLKEKRHLELCKLIDL